RQRAAICRPRKSRPTSSPSAVRTGRGSESKTPGRAREDQGVTIFGVALLSVCTLLGALLGDLLGMALHVKSNVGGVGIAMILLIGARAWLQKRGALSHPLKLGVEFWAS